MIWTRLILIVCVSSIMHSSDNVQEEKCMRSILGHQTYQRVFKQKLGQEFLDKASIQEHCLVNTELVSLGKRKYSNMMLPSLDTFITEAIELNVPEVKKLKTKESGKQKRQFFTFKRHHIARAAQPLDAYINREYLQACTTALTEKSSPIELQLPEKCKKS